MSGACLGYNKIIPEAQTKTCQNCKAQFAVEPEDFSFYEKIKVPPPTFCFDCRARRRMAFRNERALYRRKCDFPGHTEELISIFAPDNPQRVYDHAAWWGDGWDPLKYGRAVDFSRPFFEQVHELWREVPDIALMNINPVNSEYCSITEGNKNCYLVFGGDFNEDTLYSTYCFHSKFCADTYWVEKAEFNYETVDCISCSRLQYSRYCEGCYDSMFLFNCHNCHDCFGCVNLVNGSYQIFNVQYTKEDYQKKLNELNLSSRRALDNVKEKFAEHMLKYPRRFAKMIHCTNSSGDNLENCKNCMHCFDVFGGGEDCRHVFLSYSAARDSLDVDRVGMGTELCYECSTVYPGSRAFFSRFVFTCHDVQYSYNVHNAAYLFGCVGVRNKQYCILNKQYSKEEYEALVPKIIAHMNAMPYRDAAGREYRYGEFFPAELSPFTYNETLAQEMFPLTPDAAKQKGYPWREPDEKKHVPTIAAGAVPDTLRQVPDAIVDEIIECAHKGACMTDQCTKAFRVVPAELALYRKMNIPLPALCPSCRHFARIRQRNPMTLWKRACQCAGAGAEKGGYKNFTKHFHGDVPCPNAFQTTYAPDRPEIVYCEQCYQAEVA